MKMTRAFNYAFSALMELTIHPQNRPVPSHEIARKRGIPERFLLKVLKPLVNFRILSSIKGPNGGYRLAKAPDKTSMLEIIEAIDGPMTSATGMMPAGNADQIATNDILANFSERETTLTRKRLGGITLADVIKTRPTKSATSAKHPTTTTKAKK